MVVSGRRTRSIEPAWFERLFAEQGDPWDFETSAYEAGKYERTLAALPCPHYPSALEIGCANGVLTRRLAPLCADLLAIDVSDSALVQARARCADLPQVRFENRLLPGDVPPGRFDLILLSEVAYYWDRADVARAATWLADALVSGGDLLLVHWIGDTDYPLSGDEAVGALAAGLGDAVTVVLAERHERYRLDLWRRR
jgi:SAM-dependent methyltransferase